jgi:alkyldihydroxyacetonephosphate synthase
VTASTYPVWGWGRPEEEPAPAELEAFAPAAQALLGFPLQAPERPAGPPALPAPRVAVPEALAPVGSAAPLDRARHGLGRSYRDVLRGLRGQVDHPPDLVLRPRTEAEVAAALEWCSQAGVALVPFGGGTSVVGGVEPAVGRRFGAVVSLDLGALAGVAAVDEVSSGLGPAPDPPGGGHGRLRLLPGRRGRRARPGPGRAGAGHLPVAGPRRGRPHRHPPRR